MVDQVSPRQAVACGCPGAGVHPLVCEAGLQAGSGCSWTGPSPRRVWVWSLPTGGWTWAPGSTGAGPCVPIQHLSGVRGWLSRGCRGLKDSSDSLSAGEGCGRTSLPAWLLGLRLPMLCVLLGATCRRYWARGRVPPWRWPAAASLGRDQLPVWLPPVSCPQCHGLPLRDTLVSRWVRSGSFEVPASALGCAVCEALCVPAGAESLLPTALGDSPREPHWPRSPAFWGLALPGTGPQLGRPSAPRCPEATSVVSRSATDGPPLLPSCGGRFSLLSCGGPFLASPVTMVILESPGGPCSGSPAPPSRPSPHSGHSGGPWRAVLRVSCSAILAVPSRSALCVCGWMQFGIWWLS